MRGLFGRLMRLAPRSREGFLPRQLQLQTDRAPRPGCTAPRALASLGDIIDTGSINHPEVRAWST